MVDSSLAGLRDDLRTWLRDALRGGLLDRVPREYRPAGSVHVVRTGPYARALLANLSGPSARPVLDVVADAVAFHEWTEAPQAVPGPSSRDVDNGAEVPPIVFEPFPDDDDDVDDEGDWEPPARPTTDPDRHPLYDRWVDG